MTITCLASSELLSSDAVMSKLVNTYDPPKIGKTPIFTSLVRAVISQQLSEAAASRIFKKLRDLSDISPTNLLGIELEAYRSCGISRPKAGYIKAISQATLEGHLDNIESLSDDEAIKTLTRLKGVGRWTAEMILIFALGREDVWPTDDTGLVRAAKNLYDLKNVDEFIILGNRFKPFRTHAAWYLWCSLDSKI